MPLRKTTAFIATVLACCSAITPYVCNAFNENTSAITASAEDAVTTTSLSINVYDATNDPDHTLNEPIEAGYEIIITGNDTNYYNIVQTDNSGNAKIDKIPAGNYTITLTGTGENTTKKYLSVTSSNIKLTTGIGMTLSLYTKNVSDRAMLSFAFCEYKNGTPNANVKYAPIGANVTITNKKTGASYTSTSNGNGLVLFNGIDEGDYTFTINSMPTGYSAVVSEGSVSGITTDGSKTMNIPTYVTEMSDISISFNLKQWIVTSNQGMSDQEKIKYNLCKYENKEYTVIKTFTYNELINGTATYEMTAEERNFAWYLILANPEECGYTSIDTPLTGLADNSTTQSITYSPVLPKIITNNVTIVGDAGNEINICLRDENLISELDTKTNISITIPENGSITVEDIPFGEYWIRDTTLDTMNKLSITKADKSQTITIPSEADCYIETYTLYDIYGKLVEQGNGQMDDIVKPASQGNRTALYRVVLEAGNPYSSIGTAITANIIRINADGTIDELNQMTIGDGNSDGKFNIADIVSLQKFLLNVEPKACPNWKVIDLDCDNRLTVFDLCMAKRIILDKTNS